MIDGLKMTKRDAGKETRPITINTDSGIIEIGGKSPIIIAGPCSVESEDQIVSIARAVKKAGANLLRGGAYKPRTSPYTFRGLGPKGLEYLLEAGQKTGLPVVSEIMEI